MGSSSSAEGEATLHSDSQRQHRQQPPQRLPFPMLLPQHQLQPLQQPLQQQPQQQQRQVAAQQLRKDDSRQQSCSNFASPRGLAAISHRMRCIQTPQQRLWQQQQRQQQPSGRPSPKTPSRGSNRK